MTHVELIPKFIIELILFAQQEDYRNIDYVDNRLSTCFITVLYEIRDLSLKVQNNNNLLFSS